MKKILMGIMIICVAVACLGMVAHCQDDSMIEQSESQIDQNLSYEISSQQAEAQSEVNQVDASMDITGN